MVAKAGVDALSVQTAIEQGPRGITSNVLAPGPIVGTEGTDRLIKNGDVSGAGKGIPSGRFGHVKDVADATVFLFSDAGNYINGETLVGKLRPLYRSRQKEAWLIGDSVRAVDGGAWHTGRADAGRDFPYPDFLLSGETVQGLKGGRKTKL